MKNSTIFPVLVIPDIGNFTVSQLLGKLKNKTKQNKKPQNLTGPSVVLMQKEGEICRIYTLFPTE